MPLIEPKQIQKELSQKQVWPVYWLFGGEQMKARELTKRIVSCHVGDDKSKGFGMGQVQNLQASELSAEELIDDVNAIPLGGGQRVFVIKESHQLKNIESLEKLFSEKKPSKEIDTVCVFQSTRNLDKRRKFFKELIKKAAVVPCEEISERDREHWIAYLAKRRNLNLSSKMTLILSQLEPWSLDIIDQELEKADLSGDAETCFLDSQGGLHTEKFLFHFFMRNRKDALAQVESFYNHPDEYFPLIGLINWNVAQMLKLKLSQSAPKMNPYFAQRFKNWNTLWTETELFSLEKHLGRIDLYLKQTPRLPLGVWHEFVFAFTHAN